MTILVFYIAYLVNNLKQIYFKIEQTFKEPTLNALNYSDFNKSFDNFVHTIKLVSNGELNFNLNEIDTTHFESKFGKMFNLFYNWKKEYTF